jgi:methyl-accepting chemotaxis protein
VHKWKGLIMQAKGSIRAQIVKTLLLLGVLMVALLGIGFYVIFDAKDPLGTSVQEYNVNREVLYETRMMLEQLDANYRLLYTDRQDRSKTYLETIAKLSDQVFQNLEVMFTQQRKVNRGGVASEIGLLRDRLRESELRARTQAEAYASGKLKLSSEQASSFSADFAELSKSYGEIRTHVLAQSERELLHRMQSLVLMFVPILVALLVIPVSVFWAAARRINRDLIGYIRSLYSLSEQNEKSSERLRTASELMSTASSQQSAAIQQTSSSITEIRSMLAETEKRVREVQLLTSEMDVEASGGREIMQKLERSMYTIEETNRQIESFEEILSQIQAKTQVINDIVFKTQLLSFNASIEAARAGQYGRGFSVVAEEVGKLAMMSGDAAREIDQLLGQSAERVSRIVGSVNEKVRDGKGVSQDALTKFSDLATKLGVIAQKVDQVAHATTEQASGIDQTVRAMEQVNVGASENKRGADEVHQIADFVFELSAKIREVTTGIRRFVREDRRDGKSIGRTGSGTAASGNEHIEKVVPLERKTTSFMVKRKVVKSDTDVGSEKVIAVGGQRPTRAISADDPSFKKAGD